MNDAALRDVFQRHCQAVSQVIIKKGNAQGHFDKFCYGFVTINMPEDESQKVIDKISIQHPNWRLKVKEDGPDHQAKPEKFQRPNFQQQQYTQPNLYQIPHHIQQPIMQMPPPSLHTNQHHQSHQSHQNHQSHHIQPISHQTHHLHQPIQSMQAPNQYSRQQNVNYSQQLQNEKGQIYGEKKNRIMVRQLWLGGIPEMIDHSTMSEVMSEFGPVQSTEIFPKFAFVKFKKAVDAALAYERAARIFEIFGQNPGFRIAFSDPSRRKQIVANHFEFEKTAVLLPVLFLGFPPITSANVEINHMMSICQKFGTIINYYLKKSTNAQMRSYILFTYDNLKNALRAKQQLCRRKDLLGQKRVQITLLLDQDSVLKSRDFSYTQRHFANEIGAQKSKKIMKPGFNPPLNGFNSFQNPLVPGNYQNPIVPPPYSYQSNNQYSQPQQQQPQQPHHQHSYSGGQSYGYFPPPQPNYMQTQKQSQKQSSHDVLDILHSVYDEQEDPKKKGPQKNQLDKQQNTSDIIRNMLGKPADQKKHKNDEDEGQIPDDDPSWSGFLTWKGGRRAGVDGSYVNQGDFTDFNINIGSLIANQDVLVKDKINMMRLEPTNSISQPVFNQYVKILKKRTGICITKNWLIYITGKNELSESLAPIKESQLLIVMEKPTIVNQIRDRIAQINDSLFE